MSADSYNENVLSQVGIHPSLLTTLTRIAQAELGIVVDGKFGPKTRAAIAAAEPPDQQRIISGGIEIPRNRQELIEWLGLPDGLKEPSYLVSRKGLPNLPPGRWVTAHPAALDRLQRGLSRTRQQFDKCGSYVHRHIRHDPHRPLSLHSWGVAFDLDPSRNSARNFRRGECPVPWSQAWMERWPNGVTYHTVKELLIEGFTWGGVWISRRHLTSFDDTSLQFEISKRAAQVTFADPMHFQLCG